MSVKPTLFVLAAGMGSRYGGLKQLDGLGPHGETIMDYSIYDALRAGLSGRYIPFDIARHDDLSTSARLYADPALITAKGAVFTHIHPASWPLRMLVHALRNIKNNNGISTFRYLKSWLNGAFSN